ncbi:MAG: bifunctional DNA primase/polymerase [Pseudonocardiaceae bacterium]
MTTLEDPATTPVVDAIHTSLRAWALHFAARGWHVFPITPGAKKPPVIDRWESRASTDPEQITHWWQHTAYSIGIATGPSKLVVVDLDTPKPGEPVPSRWATLGIGSGTGVLRALARQHATTITPTFTASTPSGGWHLYYTAPPGTQLRNTHGMIGWKIICRRSWCLLLRRVCRGEGREVRLARRASSLVAEGGWISSGLAGGGCRPARWDLW